MTFDFVKVTIKSRFHVGSTINFVHYVTKQGLRLWVDLFFQQTVHYKTISQQNKDSPIPTDEWGCREGFHDTAVFSGDLTV